MATTEISKIYDTVLSVPGMNDNVKIELKIPRKTVFLLSKIIERGLSDKPDNTGINVLSLSDAQTLQELRNVPDDFLRKAGLTDLDEKLKKIA